MGRKLSFNTRVQSGASDKELVSSLPAFFPAIYYFVKGEKPANQSASRLAALLVITANYGQRSAHED